MSFKMVVTNLILYIFLSIASKLLFLLGSDGFTLAEKVNNFWKVTICHEAKLGSFSQSKASFGVLKDQCPQMIDRYLSS